MLQPCIEGSVTILSPFSRQANVPMHRVLCSGVCPKELYLGGVYTCQRGGAVHYLVGEDLEFHGRRYQVRLRDGRNPSLRVSTPGVHDQGELPVSHRHHLLHKRLLQHTGSSPVGFEQPVTR